MISHTTKSFRKLFRELPPDVQKTAYKAYKLWRENERHSSLEFKQVHKIQPIFSVRISLGWRAVGIKKETTMIWYWVGSHNDYDKLLNQL